MRLIKSSKLGHVDSKGIRHPVYSVDIQPKGRRLATGGGDRCVRIWHFDAIYSKNTTDEDINGSLLSTLSSHTGSVNVVRWSLDGAYLASGSDDQCILIYRHSNEIGKVAGSGGNNKEMWLRCYTLRGHGMDVLDLDWSHKGMIASASIDNKVMVWSIVNNTAATTTGAVNSNILSPFKILDGHVSHVKGVSFDPVGRFLATSSTDDTVIVWDCNSWEMIKVVTEPLKGSPDRTLFRRLSWAPDGSGLCVTSAMKSSKPIGCILKRSSWQSVADLVGHNAPSLSCRFCPDMVQVNSIEIASCVAIGDQLGVLSVWSTATMTPLLVLRDTFDNDITDIVWVKSKDGTGLAIVCCSLDGSIAIVDFDSGIGTPMAAADVDTHFKKLYGRGKSEIYSGSQDTMVEDPALLQYYNPVKDIVVGVTTTAAASSIGSGPDSIQSSYHGQSSSFKHITSSGSDSVSIEQSQIRSKTANGKKRITPVMIQTSAVCDGNDVCEPATYQSSLQATGTASFADNSDATRQPQPLGPIDTATDTVKRKRIELPSAAGTATTHATVPVAATASGSGSSILRLSFNKEEMVSTVSVPRDSGLPLLCTVDTLPSSSTVGAGVGALLRPLVNASSLLTIQVTRVPRPAILTSTSGSGSGNSSSSKSVGSSLFSSVALYTDISKAPVWLANIPGDAVCICGVQDGSRSNTSAVDGIVFVGCKDGSLYVLSLACGLQLSPPLILGAAVTHVCGLLLFNANSSSRAIRAMALSASGEMWVWNVCNGNLHCCIRDNIRSIIVSMKTTCALSSSNDSKSSAVVEQCVINERGVPMVFARCAGEWQGFAYSSEASVWTRVADSKHIMSRLFCILPNTTNSSSSGTSGTVMPSTSVAELEAMASNNTDIGMHEIVSTTRARQASDGTQLSSWTNMVTVSHVENKLCILSSIGSAAEHRQWLKEWVVICCKCNLTSRLQWMANTLIHNLSAHRTAIDHNQAVGSSLGWGWLDCDTVTAVSLLKEVVLPAIASTKVNQSLLIDINEAMESVLG